MPLSDCTRSSSEGSRPRPCCHRPIPPPCCSGHCSLPDRSTCARSMAGKRSPPSQSISPLTSPHDQIPSSCWRSRRGNSNHNPDGTATQVRIPQKQGRRKHILGGAAGSAAPSPLHFSEIRGGVFHFIQTRPAHKCLLPMNELPNWCPRRYL